MQPTPSDRSGVMVRHRVPGFSERWVIYEGTVPEAPWHDRAAEQLRAAIEPWAERVGRKLAVYRNIAVRVRQDRPSVGFDPDLALVEPAPPDPYAIDSLKLWLPEHPTPLLTFELVSKHHPTKDYVEVPDQCAAAGVFELVIFDPLRSGPKAHGGPLLLQVWRRAEDGGFERVDAGDKPARSAVLGAWLVPNERERLLVISDDPTGERPWPTRVDAQRAETEAERAAKEAALARVAELEAELGRRR